MTITESPPTQPAPAPAPEPATGRTDANPSVRSVLLGTGAVVAVIAGAGAFAAGGWIALGVVGAVGAATTTGLVRAARPTGSKRGSGRKFSITLGRKTSGGKGGPKTGRLPWSLTGNQSKRALAKGSGAGGAGRRTGSIAGRAKSRLGGLVSPAKARVSRALGRGQSGRVSPRGVPGRTPVSRGRVPKMSPGKSPGQSPKLSPFRSRKQAAAKPGVSPRTASRTPSRPGTRARLAAASKGTRRAPGTGVTGRVRPGAKARLGLPKLGAATKPSARTGSPARRTAGTGARRSIGTGGPARRLVARGRLPIAKRLGTGPTSRNTGSRLGTSKRPVLSRRRHAVPNRSARRPVPAPASTARLLRTGLGLPNLRGKRPTPAARRKARKTMGRAARMSLKHGAAATGRGLIAGGRRLRHLQLIPDLPGPIPHIPIPTDTPKLKTEPGRRHLRVVPDLEPVYTVTTLEARMSAPVQTIVEGAHALGAHEVQSMLDLEILLQDYHQIYEALATAGAAIANRLASDEPLDPAVSDAMVQMASSTGSIADMANDVFSVFQNVHEAELRRLKEPRNGEARWDVVNNQ